MEGADPLLWQNERGTEGFPRTTLVRFQSIGSHAGKSEELLGLTLQCQVLLSRERLEDLHF